MMKMGILVSMLHKNKAVVLLSSISRDDKISDVPEKAKIIWLVPQPHKGGR